MVVDLGHSPPSNSYLTTAQLDEPEVYYPLKVFVCDNCFLVQVAEYKTADSIFDENYAYFSSYSSSWLAHARAYVEMATERFQLGGDSQVIEVASNDGYLLQYFKERDVPVLGIEPTLSTATAAREKGIESLTQFFGRDLARKLVADGRSADLLLGNNVLAHVPDINDFVGGLAIALKPEGVITMEFPHLLRLVEGCQFDTIYHEHFSYISLHTVTRIFGEHDLTIFDVEELTSHGGSLRIFAAHAETQELLPNVEKVLGDEQAAGLLDLGFYLGFQERVERVKIELLDFLVKAKKEGKKVGAYGAAAKGNTLLNYAGVKNDLIEFVVDANPNKQGKLMPGSHIPIVDEARLKESKADYILIFPWNLRDEITGQIGYISAWGGKFVVAVPGLLEFRA